jgi:Arylsulfotransferase (ASST)/Secretion system C-terminal sorting domain/Cep192 domain 4
MQRITLTAFLLLAFLGLCLAQSNYNTDKFQYLSPVPGSGLLNPHTNIIIRYGDPLSNFDINDTSLIMVRGSLSGLHSGTLYITNDFKTIVFLPYNPFDYGERVYVQLSTGLKTTNNVNVDSLAFYFDISKGFAAAGSINNQEIIKINNEKKTGSLNYLQATSDSSLLIPQNFPRVYIQQNPQEKDYYFLSINKLSGRYLCIINKYGFPIFYKNLPPRVYDFKVQPSGILTYYDESAGKFYGMDSLYQVVDSFYCKNGYTTDYHDLQVLPDGHYFLISFDSEPVNMDTVVAGGDTAANVIGSVIQELNQDKVVVWQWRSWDHYKITDANPALTDFYQHAIEYCHINSIDVVDENRIIISARVLNEVTEIDRNTGIIIWRFGGLRNQFNIDPGFQFQHDARLIDNNKLSVFDNANYVVDSNSKALVFSIDEQNKTAELVNAVNHIPPVNSNNMGNVQYHDNIYTVGWGNTGNYTYYMSAFDSTGAVIYSDSLKSDNYVYSYRALKFPWKTELITTDTDTLLFENVQPGNQAQKTLKVFNNGNYPLSISGIFIRDSAFQTTQNFPLQITAKGEADINISFNPVNTKVKNSTIYIVSNTVTQMVAKEVTVIGNPNITAVKTSDTDRLLAYNLFQNYPNPFNPSTIISYEIPAQSYVSLTVYDILGRLVKKLVNGEKPAGKYSVIFNSTNFSNGVYFYKLRAGNYTQVRKMVLIK